jgi:hypothetical protein
MANIPSNISYGTVTGRFILAYGDSDDSGGEPDAIPAAGAVYFTASPVFIKDATADPAAVTILPAVVEATLDSDGYICGYGTTRGVNLVATDDPQGNPVNWTWGVEFRLTDQGGTPVALPGFSFSLPSDETVDLLYLELLLQLEIFLPPETPKQMLTSSAQTGIFTFGVLALRTTG